MLPDKQPVAKSWNPFPHPTLILVQAGVSSLLFPLSNTAAKAAPLQAHGSKVTEKSEDYRTHSLPQITTHNLLQRYRCASFKDQGRW